MCVCVCLRALQPNALGPGFREALYWQLIDQHAADREDTRAGVLARSNTSPARTRLAYSVPVGIITCLCTTRSGIHKRFFRAALTCFHKETTADISADTWTAHMQGWACPCSSRHSGRRITRDMGFARMRLCGIAVSGLDFRLVCASPMPCRVLGSSTQRQCPCPLASGPSHVCTRTTVCSPRTNITRLSTTEPS